MDRGGGGRRRKGSLWNNLFQKKEGKKRQQQFYDSEEEGEGGYEHQSLRLEQFSAPRDDLNYQIEKRLAIIETQMAEIRQLLRNQRQTEPVPRAKPTQTVSLSKATGKASRRGL